MVDKQKNVSVNIRALVSGLADVRELISSLKELNKLRGAVKQAVAGAKAAQTSRTGTASRTARGKATGKDLAAGVQEGVKESTGTLEKAGAQAVDAVVQGMKKRGKIGSPSQETADAIGKPLVQGIAKGVEDAGHLATKAGEKVIADITTGMKAKAASSAKEIALAFISNLQTALGASAHVHTRAINQAAKATVAEYGQLSKVQTRELKKLKAEAAKQVPRKPPRTRPGKLAAAARPAGQPNRAAEARARLQELASENHVKVERSKADRKAFNAQRKLDADRRRAQKTEHERQLRLNQQAADRAKRGLPAQGIPVRRVEAPGAKTQEQIAKRDEQRRLRYQQVADRTRAAADSKRAQELAKADATRSAARQKADADQEKRRAAGIAQNEFNQRRQAALNRRLTERADERSARLQTYVAARKSRVSRPAATRERESAAASATRLRQEAAAIAREQAAERAPAGPRVSARHPETPDERRKRQLNEAASRRAARSQADTATTRQREAERTVKARTAEPRGAPDVVQISAQTRAANARVADRIRQTLASAGTPPPATGGGGRGLLNRLHRAFSIHARTQQDVDALLPRRAAPAAAPAPARPAGAPARTGEFDINAALADPALSAAVGSRTLRNDLRRALYGAQQAGKGFLGIGAVGANVALGAGRSVRALSHVLGAPFRKTRRPRTGPRSLLGNLFKRSAYVQLPKDSKPFQREEGLGKLDTAQLLDQIQKTLALREQSRAAIEAAPATGIRRLLGLGGGTRVTRRLHAERTGQAARLLDVARRSKGLKFRDVAQGVGQRITERGRPGRAGGGGVSQKYARETDVNVLLKAAANHEIKAEAAKSRLRQLDPEDTLGYEAANQEAFQQTQLRDAAQARLVELGKHPEEIERAKRGYAATGDLAKSGIKPPAAAPAAAARPAAGGGQAPGHRFEGQPAGPPADLTGGARATAGPRPPTQATTGPTGTPVLTGNQLDTLKTKLRQQRYNRALLELAQHERPLEFDPAAPEHRERRNAVDILKKEFNLSDQQIAQLAAKAQLEGRGAGSAQAKVDKLKQSLIDPDISADAKAGTFRRLVQVYQQDSDELLRFVESHGARTGAPVGPAAGIGTGVGSVGRGARGGGGGVRTVAIGSVLGRRRIGKLPRGGRRKRYETPAQKLAAAQAQRTLIPSEAQLEKAEAELVAAGRGEQIGAHRRQHGRIAGTATGPRVDIAQRLGLDRPDPEGYTVSNVTGERRGKKPTALQERSHEELANVMVALQKKVDELELSQEAFHKKYPVQETGPEGEPLFSPEGKPIYSPHPEAKQLAGRTPVARIYEEAEGRRTMSVVPVGTQDQTTGRWVESRPLGRGVTKAGALEPLTPKQTEDLNRLRGRLGRVQRAIETKLYRKGLIPAAGAGGALAPGTVPVHGAPAKAAVTAAARTAQIVKPPAVAPAPVTSPAIEQAQSELQIAQLHLESLKERESEIEASLGSGQLRGGAETRERSQLKSLQAELKGKQQEITERQAIIEKLRGGGAVTTVRARREQRQQAVKVAAEKTPAEKRDAALAKHLARANIFKEEEETRPDLEATRGRLAHLIHAPEDLPAPEELTTAPVTPAPARLTAAQRLARLQQRATTRTSLLQSLAKHTERYSGLRAGQLTERREGGTERLLGILQKEAASFQGAGGVLPKGGPLGQLQSVLSGRISQPKTFAKLRAGLREGISQWGPGHYAAGTRGAFPLPPSGVLPTVAGAQLAPHEQLAAQVSGYRPGGRVTARPQNFLERIAAYQSRVRAPGIQYDPLSARVRRTVGGQFNLPGGGGPAPAQPGFLSRVLGRGGAAGGGMQRELAAGMARAGAAAMAGLVKGMKAGQPAVKKAGDITGQNVIDSTSKKLKTKSPSKVFEGIGRDTVDGLIKGIKKGSPAAIKEANRLAEGVIDSAEKLADVDPIGKRLISSLRNYGRETNKVAEGFQRLQKEQRLAGQIGTKSFREGIRGVGESARARGFIGNVLQQGLGYATGLGALQAASSAISAAASLISNSFKQAASVQDDMKLFIIAHEGRFGGGAQGRQKAEEFFRQGQRFSVNQGGFFETTKIIGAQNQLVNQGRVAPEQVNSILEAIANLAVKQGAGGGVEGVKTTFDTLTQAVTQLASRETDVRGGGAVLEGLKAQGIDLYDLVARGAGGKRTGAALEKDVLEGREIGTGRAILESLLRGIQQTPELKGLGERAVEETTAGQQQKLANAMEIRASQALGKAVEGYRDAIGEANKLLVSEGAGKFVAAISTASESFINVMKGAVKAIGTGDIGDFLTPLKTLGEQVVEGFKSGWAAVEPTFTKALGSIVSTMGPAITAAMTAAAPILEKGINDAFAGVQTKFDLFINAVMKKLGLGGEELAPLAPGAIHLDPQTGKWVEGALPAGVAATSANAGIMPANVQPITRTPFLQGSNLEDIKGVGTLIQGFLDLAEQKLEGVRDRFADAAWNRVGFAPGTGPGQARPTRQLSAKELDQMEFFKNPKRQLGAPLHYAAQDQLLTGATLRAGLGQGQETTEQAQRRWAAQEEADRKAAARIVKETEAWQKRNDVRDQPRAEPAQAGGRGPGTFGSLMYWLLGPGGQPTGGAPAGPERAPAPGLFRSVANVTGAASRMARRGGGGIPAAVRQWDPIIEEMATKYGVDPNLVRAIMKQESTGNARATSRNPRTGAPIAHGLMQLIPKTAERFGVKGNIYDPRQNIMGGTRYLKYLLDFFKGDITKVIASYNAGEGAVQAFSTGQPLRAGSKVINPRGRVTAGGIPPYLETQNYVRKVSATLQQLTGGQSPEVSAEVGVKLGDHLESNTAATKENTATVKKGSQESADLTDAEKARLEAELQRAETAKTFALTAPTGEQYRAKKGRGAAYEPGGFVSAREPHYEDVKGIFDSALTGVLSSMGSSYENPLLEFARSFIGSLQAKMAEYLSAQVTESLFPTERTGKGAGGFLEKLGGLFGFGKKAVKAARGGLQRGPGTSTSDSIPALLSNREYVLDAATTRNVGVSNLDRLRALKGMIPKRHHYAVGGRIFIPSAEGLTGGMYYNPYEDSRRQEGLITTLFGNDAIKLREDGIANPSALYSQTNTFSNPVDQPVKRRGFFHSPLFHGLLKAAISGAMTYVSAGGLKGGGGEEAGEGGGGAGKGLLGALLTAGAGAATTAQAGAAGHEAGHTALGPKLSEADIVSSVGGDKEVADSAQSTSPNKAAAQAAAFATVLGVIQALLTPKPVVPLAPEFSPNRDPSLVHFAQGGLATSLSQRHLGGSDGFLAVLRRIKSERQLQQKQLTLLKWISPDRKLRELQRGGLQLGPGTSTSDSIPALLSNREYVMPASAVRKYGVGVLEAMRKGKLASYLDRRPRGSALRGGDVSKLVYAGVQPRAFIEGGLAQSTTARSAALPGAPSDMPSAMSTGGGGGTRIINVLDKGLITDHMASAEGERVVMNIITRNKSQIRTLSR